MIDAHKIQITVKDIDTPSGLNWLSDKIINFYMKMIEARAEADVMAVGTDKEKNGEEEREDAAEQREDAGEQALNSEEPEEARAPWGLCQPCEPTAKEIEEHYLTHLPFRNWCPHCIAGRGHSDHHKRQLRDVEQEVPTVSVDYAFMNSKNGEESMQPMIVLKDRMVSN